MSVTEYKKNVIDLNHHVTKRVLSTNTIKMRQLLVTSFEAAALRDRR